MQFVARFTTVLKDDVGYCITLCTGKIPPSCKILLAALWRGWSAAGR
jgi:hypothetical protein